MFADGATTKKSARNFLGNDVTLVSRWPKSAFVYLRNPTVTKKSKKQKKRFAQPLYCMKRTFTAHQVQNKDKNRTSTHNIKTVAHPYCAVYASPEFHSVSSWARGR